MTTSGARLSVVIGATQAAAAVQDDGPPAPVVFPTGLTSPAIVDGQYPMGALDQTRLDTAGTATGALAHLLTQIAEHATSARVRELVLTAPASWGPRRRALLTDAAAQANLPTPTIIAEPVAAAAHIHQHQPIPTDRHILVCHIDDQKASLAAVTRTADGWAILADADIADAGTDRLTRNLADQLTPDDETVTANVRAALPQLVAAGRAAVLMPTPHPPTTLTSEDLHTALADVHDRLHTAAADVVTAADIDPDHLTAVIVHGDATDLINPGPHLTRDFPMTTAHHLTQHDLATAALHATNGDLTRHASRQLTSVRNLAAILTPAAAGITLAWQEYTNLDLLLPHRTPYSNQGDFYAKLAVYLNPPTIAAAGMFLTLAAITAGTTIATALHRHHNNDQPHIARNAGTSLAFAAGIGLTLAALLGLLAEGVYGHPAPAYHAPDFLSLALAAAALPALAAIGIGLLAPRVPAIRVTAWPRRLAHPTWAIALAGLGCIGMATTGTNQILGISIGSTTATIYGRAGAASIGIAIALTLINTRIARTVLATVLAPGLALVFTWPLDRTITTSYLVVVSLWWLRRAITIAAPVIPRTWTSQTGSVVRTVTSK